MSSSSHARASAPALLHIDLDRFKQINDTLGHAAGDAMLVHAAQRAEVATCAPDDFVARIGGDEFVVLCRSTARRARWTSCSPRSPTASSSRCASRCSIEGHECRFGVSDRHRHATATQVADPQRLLVNADIALYRAKSRGRNRHEFFTDALQAEIVTTKRIADDILSRPRAQRVRRLLPAAVRCRDARRSSASRRWRAGTIRPRACWRRTPS